MDQAVLEKAMEAALLRDYGVAVQYGTESLNLDVAEGRPYPIELVVDTNGKHRTLQSKYLIGADGAHSWTRHQTDIEMVGECTSEFCRQNPAIEAKHRSAQYWGVADIYPLTNFRKHRSPTSDERQAVN